LDFWARGFPVSRPARQAARQNIIEVGKSRGGKIRFTVGHKKDIAEGLGGSNDMTSLTALLSKWPLVRQIREQVDGTGLESMSDKTRALHARIDDAQVARSICPYCGVGCGQLIYHKDGKLVSIEGDPESPISQGNLCPKGAASYQLLTHNRRETKTKYRAPRAKEWSEISLNQAMDMVADRVWESRKRTFVHKENGATINHTAAICHLGGATLDNEENYLIKKLFTGGLGMVCISNQARI
jgi:formate dehydrogenase major subunit